MHRDETERLGYICTYVIATAANCGYTKQQLVLASHCTQYSLKGIVQHSGENVHLLSCREIDKKISFFHIGTLNIKLGYIS